MAKNHLPKGARALLIALQTPAPKGQAGIPVLIWGRPGVGKSSFVDSLQRDDFPVLTLIASIHDPTDFSGLPVFKEEKVHYAQPGWLDHFADKEEGLLFLDELTTAPPAVQAALLRVVLERRVGFHRLPDGVRVVAAANPAGMMVGGWELNPPLRNRFVHIQWDLPLEAYLDGLTNGFPTAVLPDIPKEQHAELEQEWRLKVAAFLKRMPEALHGALDESQFAFASPRSWETLAALLASCQILDEAPTTTTRASAACINLIQGCIGEALAVTFVSFLLELKLPDPVEILDGKAPLALSELDDSEVFILFNGLASHLRLRFESDRLLDSGIRYLDLLDQVFVGGRRDLVYASLKRMCKEGFLTKLLAAGQHHSSASRAKAMEKINHLFEDEGLRDFIDVFEQ